MSEVGADVGKTAIAGVGGAVKVAAEEVVADTVKAMEKATSSTIKTAEELRTDTAEGVCKVLKTTKKNKTTLKDCLVLELNLTL